MHCCYSAIRSSRPSIHSAAGAASTPVTVAGKRQGAAHGHLKSRTFGPVVGLSLTFLHKERRSKCVCRYAKEALADNR